MPLLVDDDINDFEIPEIPDFGPEGAEPDLEDPVRSGPIAAAAVEVDVAIEAHETVVRLEEESEDNGDIADIPAVPIVAIMEETEAETPASAAQKKAGRPSKASSRTSTPAKTPAPAKTPRSTKSATAAPSTVSRKRKAADKVDAPPAKRAAHGRAAANKADAAIKEAANVRQRAPRGSKKEEKPKGTRGRPKKPKTDVAEPAGDEFEVEAILDSGVDDDTKEHLYLVKWKGYDVEANTWEPKRNLAHATDLLKKFTASKRKTSAKGPKEPRKPREKKAKSPTKKAVMKTAAPKKRAAPKPRGVSKQITPKATPKKATGTGRGRGRPPSWIVCKAGSDSYALSRLTGVLSYLQDTAECEP
ncbi:hypothetical protein NKR23_g2653 [Pleurostoma richardsiae]|uniref:Chromo domain-containing protein n=1 Tax=Pleurostoma richardsiae TaxID=41990 RepID=A0AA38RLJ5_9PEZI|nr:hypothetical protein NKR23_g2653 [Pleurostoma richardsiae]